MQIAAVKDLKNVEFRKQSIKDRIGSVVLNSTLQEPIMQLFEDIQQELSKLEAKLKETVEQKEKSEKELEDLEDIAVCHVCYETYGKTQPGKTWTKNHIIVIFWKHYVLELKMEPIFRNDSLWSCNVLRLLAKDDGVSGLSSLLSARRCQENILCLIIKSLI